MDHGFWLALATINLSTKFEVSISHRLRCEDMKGDTKYWTWYGLR